MLLYGESTNVATNREGEDVLGATPRGKRSCEIIPSWSDPKVLIPVRPKNTYIAAVPHKGPIPAGVKIAGRIN